MCNTNPASLFANSVKNNAFVQLNQSTQPKNTPTMSRFKLFRHLTILSALLCFVVNGWGQVSNYSFTTSTGTYTAITGGTVSSSGSALDDGIVSVTLPTPFIFNGTTVTTIGFSTNGYLILGSISSHGYTPISSTTTSTGVISPFGVDLVANATTAETRWQQIGNEIIFQWKHFRRYLATPEQISFQIRLNTSNGQIIFVYDGSTTVANSITRTPQVGLRGATNADYNARRLTTSVPTATPSWSNTAAASSNAHNVRFTSGSPAAFPSSGLTFTWTPPQPCAAPTSLALTASSSAQSNTTISASFTAASSAPTAYLVVRNTTNTQPVPVTGTTYTTGSNAIGFIEYVGASAGTWTSTSLSAGVTYYYWVFSYNNTNCTGGPVYSSSTTSFSQATSSCTGAALENLTYNTTTASYCLSAAITSNTATLGTTSGVPTYSISPALPTGLTLSTSTGAISGTPTAAVASTNYTVTADNGCTNTTATLTLTTIALPATPASSAATSAGTYGFTANWTASAEATAYFLDVSTSSSFTSMVSGYDGLNVGTVTSYAVTGLGSGTTYYYRVRSTNGTCNSLNSSSQTIATTALSSVATGDWNSASTWSGGQVPTCNDNVTILTGNTVTVNSNSNVSKNTTINSGGTLVVASGDLTVGCTLNNTTLTNNGTLTVTGGTLNVNGNISSALGSTFNQSGGAINIDGNNGGSTTGSVASGTPLLNLLQLNSGINWTGGTLTIVDPHTATTNTNGYAVFYSNSITGSNYPSANHTIQFGNGVSTDAGGHTSGFYFNQWVVNAFLPIGSCVVNGPSGVNRSLNFYYSPMHIQGNVSVNNGGLLNGVTVFYIGGNILVNSGGSFINPGTVVTGTISSNTGYSTTPAAVSIAQTIGGSGTFQNLATSSTASLTSLTINNTSSSGVTISAPLSLSGTLTMTAGKINTTATNLLTLGTATAAGTLAYTGGQITGPFARTFASSSSTTAVYDNTTLFPVGDGTNYIPIHIDPVNGGGVVQIRGQAFNTNTGTAGTGVASVLSTDRWEALVTSGTITDCFIGLNDAQIASGNIIAQSSSANGTYNAVSGASTFVSGTPNALRTAVAIPNASYSGYFTYAAPGPVITSFTPSSACPNAATTITITGTNLGSATGVTLNGEACTITANSATSITITTDATPQAGSIVVTTSANSATSGSALSLFTLPTVTASSDASNNTICSGSNVTLNGGGANSYVWNNGVTDNTSFTPIATNSYTVTGTDGNGCVNTASITITVNNAVSISSQPVNAVVLPNTDATFSVSATGTGLTYQWEENTGSTWSSITNGGIYSGATTNTLTLTAVTLAESGYQYRCVVSGTTPCAAATTTAATLTISTTAISAQPQNQSICSSSGTASFSVSTTGSTPTYQWQLSTNSGSSWSDITGEISATLSLSNLTLQESGNLYHCVLNNTITSSNALLTVSPVSVAGTVSSDQAICSGSTPSSITLSGNTGSIQWQVSTDNTSFSDISGATTSTLAASTIGALTSTRYYRAVVTNGGCSAATSGVVTVTVTPTPNAGTLSGTQVVCANSTSSFTSNGDAGGAWTSANTAVATVNISTGVVSGVAAGVTTITYTITGTGGCTTTTATRTVTVNAVPPITSATATPAAVCAGETVSLSAASVAVSTGTSIASGSGTSTSTSTSYPSPFGNYYWGAKQQFIITAADLSAMGLIAGNITSVAFDITSAATASLTNFAISAKHTNTAAFTSSGTFETGLTTLYSSASYTPSSSTGYSNNTITFNTPFAWNGTSNIVFEICFNNDDYTSNASSTYTIKSYYTACYYIDDASGICSEANGNYISYNLPNMKFDGQIGTNNTSNFTWAWNTTPAVTAATGTTTAVNNTSSPATQTYNVTATAASTGCSSTATTSAITINTTPATPTANSTTVCGPQNATCSVTGSGINGNTFKWYTVPTGGTPITGQTGASLSAYLVSATTTFYVSETNANCEGARVAVVQTISTPPSVTASVTTTPICAGQSTSLSVSSTNSSYTYSWNNNAGSGATVTVTPSATTTYTVTATDASGGAYDGCAALATATVTVNPLPTAVTLTPSSAAFCNGVSSAQSLVASGGNIPATGLSSWSGSGNTLTSYNGYPTAFGNYWYQDWNQILYTAADLTAMGLQPGNLNSIRFKLGALPLPSPVSITNYSISLVSTTNTSMSSFITSGFTTVFSAASYSPTMNANNLSIINFSTSFYWNGTDNIVLDIRGTGAYGDANATTEYTATTNNSVIYAYSSSSNSNFWSSNPTPTTSTQRPNIRFDGEILSQGPITWSPTTALYTDAAATIAYTGTAATTVYALPSATTTYTATATSAAGCTSSNTVAITVNQPSVAGSVSAASSTLCAGTGTTLSLTGNTGTIQWQNSSDNVTFANMSGETASSLSTGNLTQTRYYKAVVTSGACAAANTSTETITVNANGSYIGPNVGNWNDVANWCGGLPTNTTDVLIGSGKEVTLDISGLTTVASITLGGSLTLPSTAQLTVNGTLTNNGTFTLQDGATFVQGTTGTSIAGTGTYNVEKALTDNSSNWSTTSGRFWYMGVPMVNVARDSYGTPGTTTNRLWSYTEATKSYTELSDGTALLSAGTGYVHRRSTDGTLTFSATGTNGLYGSDFTASGLTKTAGYTSGVNLVSNPYMAYLDWLAVVTASPTIDPTFYIRSNNVAGGDISALISYNANTPTLFTNTSSVVINDASQIRYIAPMQSVWVKVAASASAGTVNMNRGMLSHQSGNPGLKSSTVFPTLAKVNLVDGNRFDQMLVYMNSDMTNEVDQYDSEKLPVSGTVQVYTMASNKKLVMNGLKNNKKKVSVPLYLELPETKSYTLQLNEYVLEDGLILLEDKQEGTMQDFTLLENYTFYANSGQLHNRFVLHFILPNAELTTQGPSNSWVGSETSYTDGGNVQITNDDRGNIEITVDQVEEQKVEGNVIVTDMNGKEVYKGQLDGITTAVSLNVPAGIYYLTVQSGALFEKKKVFIQD